MFEPLGIRIDFDPSSPPTISPEALRAVAVHRTQQWLDSLGRAPTAEEVLIFAESYNSGEAPS